MSVRWGVLGTARIVGTALIRPARRLAGARVVAVASRDGGRAERFARKHGIERHHGSYEELLADDGVDAVYVPLPNSLHAEWSIRALEAQKHVLCEKPLASNAEEAARMAAAADEAGRVLAEGMHYRHHPFAQAVKEATGSDVLGAMHHIEAAMCFPILSRKDIRYRYELGGGALMDLGCYAINFVRFVAAAEPDVASVEVKLASEKVDRRVRAELAFSDGRTATVFCSMLSPRLINLGCQVTGSEGRVIIRNPYGPHVFNVLRVDTKRYTSRGMQPRGSATYFYQLKAFCEAVEGEPLTVGTAADAVKNMRVIDAIYEKAGLPKRGL